MKIAISEQKKKLLKKDVIVCRIGVLTVCCVFSFLYLDIRFLEFIFIKRFLYSEFIIGISIFVICLFGILFNIYYINQVFRRDYNNEPTIVDYSVYKDYLLIHNISIDKKTKIYKNTVKHIFYKKNCAVILTKDRHMYMIPNEVNIDFFKKETISF